MNRVKEVQRINAADIKTQLKSNTVGDSGHWDVSKSWHHQYRDSAYVYVGGLPYDLSEGDVIVIFSQFGEIVDVNLPRDKDTGKPKGFAFIAYEDQRSTVLAVDNFNGAKILGRTIRCDHCASFKEEQKKDADNLPEHLVRKLSEKELEKKKEDIVKRNAELEDASNSKAELFSDARGTGESERERDEREIRASIMHKKESEALAKRTSHIEAVLARRKGEYDKVATEEAKKEEARKEWKRQREEEEKEAARKAAEKSRSVAPLTGHAASSSKGEEEESGGGKEDASSRFERMMNGGLGGKKKKKKRKEREQMPDFGDDDDDDGGGKGGGARDAISVEETNRIRESLGLKPLRG